MRIQNIRFPEADICQEEELYFHRNGEWIDFNGYFNLFYIEKRKKYTNQETLTLHLELQGCQAVRLMKDENVLQEIALIGESEGSQTYEFDFPYQETETGVFWFSVKPAADMEQDMLNLTGWYEGTCRAEKPVRIAAVVCTFKRESYILRNVKSILRFLEQPENKAMKLCYWLVDNGRTLSEHEEISSLIKQHPDTFRIIPNRNVGGAGGFTRGMIEAIEEKENLGLTHVQMMDDDAVMDPELFVRAYGFLGMRKDEWEDIRLGGTLLREDYPYICQAMGEWFEKLHVTNNLVMTDMRSFKNCCKPLVERPHDEYKMYSGWWCCCYSLNTVREDNLPLPIFIHRDDIEYEIRNRETGVVFLNGFNVWHKGFEVNFLGTNAYYDARNVLIYAALHEPDLLGIRMWKWISRLLLSSVMKMNYEELNFIYQGVKDFMKGPKWLIMLDAEEKHNQLRKQLPIMKPMLDRVQPSMKELKEYYNPQRYNGNFWKKITFNGWLLPGYKKKSFFRPYDPLFTIYRIKKIELIDTGAGKKREASRSIGQLFKTMGYIMSIYIMLRFQYGKVQKEYKNKFEILKSKVIWR